MASGASAGGRWATPAITSSRAPTTASAAAADAERIERYVRDCVVWGTPRRVRDELARLTEVMRLRHLMIAPLSHESFVRFTDDVLPHV